MLQIPCVKVSDAADNLRSTLFKVLQAALSPPLVLLFLPVSSGADE